ncbi:Variant surface glycoprotein [Trypanosoma congolense IL3000]|uniref:Variant surface glycoprotein n=1 Tax=Trypanosoma congolense (strain IL3000) TaxID=1068625 RepID=F9W6P4_TRYCI|nr:Variant surface glycoprotein [Trypanosoma congolense IL3000]
MMLSKFLLVALLFCIGTLGSDHPSAAEFNLFCRILKETDEMLLVPDYIYDEDKDKEVVKEMQFLYNATTDNMKNFGNTMWKMKDFLKEHPPPTQPRNRQDSHNQIGQLIQDGEKKIIESWGLAKKVNEKIYEAKLLVLQGIYGENVTVVPKEDGNLTDIISKNGSIFNDETNVTASCGNGKKTGKTLINDFFCVCVGTGIHESGSPCHGNLIPPNKDRDCCKNKKCCNDGCKCCKNGCCANNKCCGTNNCCCCGCNWTQMKYGTSSSLLALTESFEKIKAVCQDLLDDEDDTKKIIVLLKEYLGMIGKGGAKQKQNKTYMFGQSAWGAEDSHEKVNFSDCTGGGNNGDKANGNWKNNNHMCVDYKNNFKNESNTYDIPWHNKFKNYTILLNDAKQIEDKILKNRAALHLLKTKAWAAYTREKDDETSNLDDMNISNLLDGTQLPPFFFLSHLSIFL